MLEGDLVRIDQSRQAYGYCGFYLRPAEGEWGLVVRPDDPDGCDLHCEVLVGGRVLVMPVVSLERVGGQNARGEDI